MVAPRYVPEGGDLVWMNFDPQAGYEQAGNRPGVVLSPGLYNRRAGLALVCPITSRSKGYPFEVVIPPGLAVRGVVLADQVRSIDWQARGVRFAGKMPKAIFEQVRERVVALLGR